MRFVMLEHFLPGRACGHPDHWDLLLDLPDSRRGLRAWRLADPLAAPGWLAATPLPPHRSTYWDHEGSTRGARGYVRRLARGECRVFADGADGFRAALASPQLVGLLEILRAGTAWHRRFTRFAGEP